MHISLRRLIFVFFVLVFVISAPLVVFYTAGYRLIISNQHLQQTGVLAISTWPRGSNIIFNGQNLAQKTPFVIQRIMPNTHDVSLQKKGYHEWSQRIRVDEGRTSYITARLFADSEPKLLASSAASLALRAQSEEPINADFNPDITFFNNGSNIEVRTGSTLSPQLIGLLPIGEYHLLEIDDQYILIANERDQAFVVAREGGRVVELATPILAYDWLPDEHLLLWTDGAEVNIYNASSGEQTFVTREGQTVADVAWHPTADSFFVVSGATLSAYDASVHETREVTPLLVETQINDIWLDTAGKNLYFTEPNSTKVFQLPLMQ